MHWRWCLRAYFAVVVVVVVVVAVAVAVISCWRIAVIYPTRDFSSDMSADIL